MKTTMLIRVNTGRILSTGARGAKQSGQFAAGRRDHPDFLAIDPLFPASRLTRIRNAWRSGAIVPLASRETTTELIRVLCYSSFRLTPHEREDLLADYLPHCESVVVSTPPPVPDWRDPFDRPFLELAKGAKADAVVTGDKDLLALVPAFPIPILTPAAALATLPAQWFFRDGPETGWQAVDKARCPTAPGARADSPTDC